ncbi:hypothetical protein P9112_012837 [Eukaryota sp. TZLM1-RC]
MVQFEYDVSFGDKTVTATVAFDSEKRTYYRTVNNVKLWYSEEENALLKGDSSVSDYCLRLETKIKADDPLLDFNRQCRDIASPPHQQASVRYEHRFGDGDSVQLMLIAFDHANGHYFLKATHQSNFFTIWFDPEDLYEVYQDNFGPCHKHALDPNEDEFISMYTTFDLMIPPSNTVPAGVTNYNDMNCFLYKDSGMIGLESRVLSFESEWYVCNQFVHEWRVLIDDGSWESRTYTDHKQLATNDPIFDFDKSCTHLVEAIHPIAIQDFEYVTKDIKGVQAYNLEDDLFYYETGGSKVWYEGFFDVAFLQDESMRDHECVQVTDDKLLNTMKLKLAPSDPRYDDIVTVKVVNDQKWTMVEVGDQGFAYDVQWCLADQFNHELFVNWEKDPADTIRFSNHQYVLHGSLRYPRSITRDNDVFNHKKACRLMVDQDTLSEQVLLEKMRLVGG